MGQQSEEEGARHTSLGGPSVQCDGAGCIAADLLQVAQRSVDPQLDQFVNELLRDDSVEC